MIMEKKNKPKFNVPNLGFFKSVKARWRKPRGTAQQEEDESQLHGRLAQDRLPQPAGDPRGMHPSGMKEVLVNSVQRDRTASRTWSSGSPPSVGGKKRALIEEKAKAAPPQDSRISPSSRKKPAADQRRRKPHEQSAKRARVKASGAKAHEVQRPASRSRTENRCMRAK